MPATTPNISPQMRECITNCQECHDACLATIMQCLETGGEHAAPDHIRLLMDCAQICATSADFMLRGSPMHPAVCGVCAAICERCATDCDRFSEDFMKRCAEVCRRCAESCRQMATMAHAA